MYFSAATETAGQTCMRNFFSAYYSRASIVQLQAQIFTILLQQIRRMNVPLRVFNLRPGSQQYTSSMLQLGAALLDWIICKYYIIGVKQSMKNTRN